MVDGKFQFESNFGAFSQMIESFEWPQVGIYWTTWTCS